MRPKQLIPTVKNFTKDHFSEIMLGIGLSGFSATLIMAVKATPKAIRILNEEASLTNDGEIVYPAKLQCVKLCWKVYLPTAIVGSASMACIIAAFSRNAKQKAAIATAYGLSEAAFREYRGKVIDMIGEKKEREVRDAIAKDRVDNNPASAQGIIVTDKGNTLCYDSMSGRYFRSDIDKIRKIENEMNRLILSNGYISLNDLYYELGLPNIKIGDGLGWNYEHGLIDISFSAQLSEDEVPCLVMDFNNAPSPDF